MDLFHIIDDAQAIIRTKGGTYRQVKVYKRGSAVFVGYGGGFVKLMSYTKGMEGHMGSGATSCPWVSWIELDAQHVTIERGGPRWEAPMQPAGKKPRN